MDFRVFINLDEFLFKPEHGCAETSRPKYQSASGFEHYLLPVQWPITVFFLVISSSMFHFPKIAVLLNAAYVLSKFVVIVVPQKPLLNQLNAAVYCVTEIYGYLGRKSVFIRLCSDNIRICNSTYAKWPRKRALHKYSEHWWIIIEFFFR